MTVSASNVLGEAFLVSSCKLCDILIEMSWLGFSSLRGEKMLWVEMLGMTFSVDVEYWGDSIV
jgi:hypothetical protein